MAASARRNPQRVQICLPAPPYSAASMGRTPSKGLCGQPQRTVHRLAAGAGRPAGPVGCRLPPTADGANKRGAHAASPSACRTLNRRLDVIRVLTTTLTAVFLTVASAAATVRLGPEQHHTATVYSGPCDAQSTIMADGTSIYSPRAQHSLASMFLRLGTRIRFDRRVFGSRWWTVRDTGGTFDLYVPDCAFGSWNNPLLGYRIAS